MARAYQCDRCKKQVTGAPDLGLRTNKPMIGINYAPESVDGTWYAHDLCPECEKAFTIWWTSATK